MVSFKEISRVAFLIEKKIFRIERFLGRRGEFRQGCVGACDACRYRPLGGCVVLSGWALRSKTLRLNSRRGDVGRTQSFACVTVSPTASYWLRAVRTWTKFCPAAATSRSRHIDTWLIPRVRKRLVTYWNFVWMAARHWAKKHVVGGVDSTTAI